MIKKKEGLRVNFCQVKPYCRSVLDVLKLFFTYLTKFFEFLSLIFKKFEPLTRTRLNHLSVFIVKSHTHGNCVFGFFNVILGHFSGVGGHALGKLSLKLPY